MTHCDLGPDTAERYVGGTMSEPERTGFEEHFFACDACFRAVQALEDARGVLADTVLGETGSTGAAPRRGLPLRWMAIAATLVIIAGLSARVWRVSRPGDVPPQNSRQTASTVEPPAARPQAEPPVPQAQAPVPTASPSASSTLRSRHGRLERWAVVIPPQYVALTTRSEQDKDAQTFEEAMTHYSAGRYRQAADGLQILAERAPTAAHVQFFLGISELMSDNASRARGALQRSADSGVSPYSDEAHFYLAKVALRADDLTAAARELEIAVDREAGPQGDAARLLAELRRVVR